MKLYHTEEARKAAIRNIKGLIDTIGKISGDELDYISSTQIIHHLNDLIKVIESENQKNKIPILYTEVEKMDEHKVKNMLSREVLNRLDGADGKLIKAIIFDDSTLINWNKAYELIMAFKPELMVFEGYRAENMR